MTLSVSFDDRNFNPRLQPQGIAWTIEEYSFEADGGPRAATIHAMGPEEAIWELLDLLRCPSSIHESELGELWWGMACSVEIQAGSLTIGLELDEMFNRIDMVFTPPSLFGRSDAQTTGWAEHQESVATFGYKEQRISVGSITEAAALARQTRELALKGVPRPSIPSFGNEGSSIATATVRCCGWKGTLDWRYYTQTKGLDGHTVNGNAVVKLGQGFTEALGFSAEGNRIHGVSNKLTFFKNGDRVRVSGHGANDGIKTIKSVSQEAPTSYTATTLAFIIETKDSTLRDSAESFAPTLGAETSTGWSLTISGSGAGNNVTKTVKGYTTDEIKVNGPLYAEGPGVMLSLSRPTAPGFPDNTYTANTITIESGYLYKLTDSANGLGDFDTGDMVNISGAGGNSGWYRVVGAASDGAWIQLDRAVTAAAAGTSITITRGSSLQVEEELTNAYPGTTVTIKTEADALRQSFQPQVSDWTLGAISLRIRKVGEPTDSLTIAIWNDAAGLPGTLLESVAWDSADLPDSLTWLPKDMSNTLTMTSTTTYHLVVERSGAINEQSYYEVAVDEEVGYTAGDLRLKIGGTWNTTNVRTPDADLVFRLVGYRETTEQIRDIVAACGQFLQGVEVRTPSSRFEPQHREGNKTALDELDKLLESGTATGERLLAWVRSDRWLIIEAEAAPTATTYKLDRHGRLRDVFGSLIPIMQPLVNVWVDIDIGPASVWRGGLLTLGRQYIERATVRPEREIVTFDFYNQDSRFSLGGIQDG